MPLFSVDFNAINSPCQQIDSSTVYPKRCQSCSLILWVVVRRFRQTFIPLGSQQGTDAFGAVVVIAANAEASGQARSEGFGSFLATSAR
jgi:hypothetical protein